MSAPLTYLPEARRLTATEMDGTYNTETEKATNRQARRSSCDWSPRASNRHSGLFRKLMGACSSVSSRMRGCARSSRHCGTLTNWADTAPASDSAPGWSRTCCLQMIRPSRALRFTRPVALKALLFARQLRLPTGRQGADFIGECWDGCICDSHLELLLVCCPRFKDGGCFNTATLSFAHERP